VVRNELRPLLQVTDRERRYEEDPYTRLFATTAATQVVVLRSRFEVDLNRPREAAIYLRPKDAWGLDVWREPPSAEVIARSLAEYDTFYAYWQNLLERNLAQNPRVVVFDFHSYNHRRSGPDSSAADPAQNPEINLGTRTMDREFWSPVVERWLAEMRAEEYLGRTLDVRENVRFGGGHLAAWTHRHFPKTVCVLAIEAKKFFIDEWSENVDRRQLEALRAVLERAAAAVADELQGFDRE
jgi:N-formylglutamate amidohydrolase